MSQVILRELKLNSAVKYVAREGFVNEFPITFAYDNPTQLQVFVGFKKVPSWELKMENGLPSVVLPEDLKIGQSITIRRSSPADGVPHTYQYKGNAQGGAEFNAKTIDENFEYMTKIAEEISDYGQISADMLEDAFGSASDLVGISTEARDTAIEAKGIAEGINAKAQEALDNSTEALNTAQGVDGKAQQALDKSQEALRLKQDLANPNMGAAMVARGVVAVDCIADLLALPEGQRKEGLRYLVKGYHAGSVIGGGEFYWDAASDSTPDGGTVLAVPDVSTGRFKRLFNLPISVEDFGIRAETAGAGTLIQQAINSVKHIHIPAKTYFDCHIIMPAESSITGTGKRSVLRYPDPQTEGEGAPIMIPSNNCYVDGVMCDGNWDGVSDLAPHVSMNFEGINVKNASRTRIGEVWVRNCSGDGIDLDGGNNHDIGTVHAENIGGSCVHPSYYEATDTFASDVRVGKIIATNCGLFNKRQCLNVFGFTPGGAKNVTVQDIYATNCYGLVGCNENTDNVHVVNAVGINIGPPDGHGCAQVVLNTRSRIDSLYMQVAFRGKGGNYIRLTGPDCSLGHVVIRDGSRAAHAGIRTDVYAARASVGYFRITFANSFGSGEGVGLMLRAPYGSVGKAIVEGAASNGARLLSNNCTIDIDTINCGQGVGYGEGSPERAGVWLKYEPRFLCHYNRVKVTAFDRQSTPTQQYGIFEDSEITQPNLIETGLYMGMVVEDERLGVSNRMTGVGAIALMAKTTPGAAEPGDIVHGSSLVQSNAAGTVLGYSPFGQWLSIGFAGGTGSPEADRVGLFRRIR